MFNELQRHGTSTQITLPCGQCIGCRLERSRVWAMRCVHEAKMYKENCFITLTYDDEHLPHRGQLVKKDFVDFMKRLRKHKQGIRFYQGGEYGTENWRPHFHAILFNWDWPDKKYFKTTGSGEKIYTSEMLEKLWPYGYSSTAEMTFESAAYIARYCLQKVTGKNAEQHYKRHDENGEYQLQPEYNNMSRMPGLGTAFYQKYKGDIINNDYVVVRGVVTNVPKFYDKILKREDPEKMRDFKEQREWKGYQNREDNTQARLNVKETVKKAALRQLNRGQI